MQKEIRKPSKPTIIKPKSSKTATLSVEDLEQKVLLIEEQIIQLEQQMLQCGDDWNALQELFIQKETLEMEYEELFNELEMLNEL